jgi:hypothetical protein
MYTILVDCEDVIIDYGKSFQLYDNACIASFDNKVVQIYPNTENTCYRLVEIQDEIVDFVGRKYLYDSGQIVINPDWEE